MKQRLETLDSHHCKAGLRIRKRPDWVRSREIAETCPAKRLQISRSGLKTRTEWPIEVAIVFGRDFVRVVSARFQPVNSRVIGENNLVIEPIGVDSLVRVHGSGLFAGIFYFDSRINRASRRGPRNGDFGRGIVPPCDMNLLRRAVVRFRSDGTAGKSGESGSGRGHS